MEEPLLEIKSKYRIFYEFVNRHMLTLAIFIGLSFCLINTEVYIPFWIAIGIYVVYVIAYTIHNVRKYNSKRYYFYEQYMIYQEGLWRKEEKEISYEFIRNVRYKQTLLQTFLKTGDIYLYFDTGNIFKNSICLYGLSDVQKNYEKIQQIVIGSRIEAEE